MSISITLNMHNTTDCFSSSISCLLFQLSNDYQHMSDKNVPSKTKNESSNKTERSSESNKRLIESNNPSTNIKGQKSGIETTGSTGPKSHENQK